MKQCFIVSFSLLEANTCIVVFTLCTNNSIALEGVFGHFLLCRKVLIMTITCMNLLNCNHNLLVEIVVNIFQL